jgi:outer membrane lipoprotein carrier protein
MPKKLPAAGRYIWCSLLTALALVAGAEQTPDAVGSDRLQAYFSATDSLRADFTQEVVDRDQQTVEVSSGRVALQKPGRFRWDYVEPFERVIVADGERIWLYEADLDQVTVQRLDAGLGETPAALLSGNADVLERFAYLGGDDEGELFWLRLGPLDDAADFEEIRLGFAGEELRRLELADRLGQTTRIGLSNIEQNAKLDPAVFKFNVPAGADVIGEDEL